jgi:hypothetical protein
MKIKCKGRALFTMKGGGLTYTFRKIGKQYAWQNGSGEPFGWGPYEDYGFQTYEEYVTKYREQRHFYKEVPNPTKVQ